MAEETKESPSSYASRPLSLEEFMHHVVSVASLFLETYPTYGMGLEYTNKVQNGLADFINGAEAFYNSRPGRYKFADELLPYILVTCRLFCDTHVEFSRDDLFQEGTLGIYPKFDDGMIRVIASRNEDIPAGTIIETLFSIEGKNNESKEYTVKEYLDAIVRKYICDNPSPAYYDAALMYLVLSPTRYEEIPCPYFVTGKTKDNEPFSAALRFKKRVKGIATVEEKVEDDNAFTTISSQHGYLVLEIGTFARYVSKFNKRLSAAKDQANRLRKVIIDIRLNGGGNTHSMVELFVALTGLHVESSTVLYTLSERIISRSIAIMNAEHDDILKHKDDPDIQSRMEGLHNQMLMHDIRVKEFMKKGERNPTMKGIMMDPIALSNYSEQKRMTLFPCKNRSIRSAMAMFTHVMFSETVTDEEKAEVVFERPDEIQIWISAETFSASLIFCELMRYAASSHGFNVKIFSDDIIQSQGNFITGDPIAYELQGFNNVLSIPTSVLTAYTINNSKVPIRGNPIIVDGRIPPELKRFE